MSKKTAFNIKSEKSIKQQIQTSEYGFLANRQARGFLNSQIRKELNDLANNGEIVVLPAIKHGPEMFCLPNCVEQAKKEQLEIQSLTVTALK